MMTDLLFCSSALHSRRRIDLFAHIERTRSVVQAVGSGERCSRGSVTAWMWLTQEVIERSQHCVIERGKNVNIVSHMQASSCDTT